MAETDASAGKATAAGRTAAGKASAGKASAGKTTASKTTAGKTAASKTAAGKTAASETTASKTTESSAAAAQATADPGGRAGLKIHHLRPAPGAHIKRTRVGRGEASKGKTAGRGTKGSKARRQIPEAFEGGQMPLHRRLPKLKGFSNSQFKTTYQVVNVGRLASLYPAGGPVTPEDLAAKGAVRAGELVKVLGQGEVAVALQVSAHGFSSSAQAKLTAAGGTVTEL
jgi:large subunit ribosomal protein L15